MASNPSSRWYWNDWENDLGLKLCSLAAQGLWMRMLSLAARSEPLGYVSLNGRSFSMGELADAIGRPETEVRPLVEELDRNHVFSRDRKGRIFSRRMVRDEQVRLLAVENGKKGGNPKLTQTLDKPIQKSHEDKGGHKGGRSPPIPLPLPLEEESIAPKGAHSELAVRRPTPRRLAEQMVEIWREVVCPVLPNVTKLTDKRIASACRRLTDEFNGSLDDWRKFLQRVRGSPMLTGENDRGWRADFDFCTRLDAVLHIIEGRYDDKRNGSGELPERRAPQGPPPRLPQSGHGQGENP